MGRVISKVYNSGDLNYSDNYLCTINSLAFSKLNENSFLIGSRDSKVKVYDVRGMCCIESFTPHKGKLNNV